MHKWKSESVGFLGFQNEQKKEKTKKHIICICLSFVRKGQQRKGSKKRIPSGQWVGNNMCLYCIKMVIRTFHVKLKKRWWFFGKTGAVFCGGMAASHVCERWVRFRVEARGTERQQGQHCTLPAWGKWRSVFPFPRCFRRDQWCAPRSPCDQINWIFI